jgi:hypothetical protein
MAVAINMRLIAERCTFMSKEVALPVSNINDGTGSPIVLVSRNKSRTNEFSNILSNTVSGKKAPPFGADNAEMPRSKSADQVSYIELGRISKETPTVSHILKNHPEYSGKCWDIIYSSTNRGTDFTKMRDGTLVALRPGSNEIVWGRKLAALANGAHPIQSETADSAMKKQGPDQSMVVGTISKENPTVSHLFEVNPNFDNRFWDIIHSPVNSGKKYSSLPRGTEVVLDTTTMELSFRKRAIAGPRVHIAKVSTEEQPPQNVKIDHGTLADAVKPYIGTPYEKIDCYGLIVRGLQNQGIQYRGHGGIREKLEALAVRNGLPGNAYFSGEGLVEKAGRKVYSKALDHVSGSREKADEIYSEMMPFLQEGFILSFSTPTQGHTGIVARQGEDWTYINSGVIDNQVSPQHLSKGVGEEFLKAELNNWLVLAAKNKEPLTVTLGHVGEDQS